MTTTTTPLRASPWVTGVREAIPLLGGYIPIAISFGLVAVQAGFSAWEAVAISTLIYAGASQFVFVGMVAGGAPLWLVVAMTLLINVRHVVYAPNLAASMSTSRWWPALMHGLTDQVFALALTRLPQLPEAARLGWYTGAALLAWLAWIAGTAVGALGGEWVVERWPLLGEVMPFALPALFLVLVVPRLSSFLWGLATLVTIAAGALLAVLGVANAGIPLAALCGALCFFIVKRSPVTRSRS